MHRKDVMMDKNEIINYLLLNTNVNFLLGAGTSVNKVEEKTSYPLMSDLLECVRTDKEVTTFCLKNKEDSESKEKMIVNQIYDNYLFNEDANVEKFLSVIDGVELYLLDEQYKNEVKVQVESIKKIIRNRLNESDEETVIEIYRHFYNGITNLKEHSSIKNQTIGVFTTNYDMLNELAMESLNIHYYSGFDGILNRIFKPVYYNYSYVDNFKYNNRYVINDTNHLNLYKLHGSLSWYKNDKNEIIELNPRNKEFIPEIIYPSVDKFDNTNMIVNFSALLREFSNNICKEKTTLIVCGMSMGDEHINKIIDNALALNSFHLIVYCFSDDDVKSVQKRYESYENVIIVGPKKTFKCLASKLISLGGLNSDDKD